MRLDSIQALRGLAAYLVLVYHVRALELLGISESGATEPALVGGLFKNGYAGVDLFFAISGFIMVYVTISRAETFSTVKDFLLARIFRIYPPWWLFAGLMCVYLVATYGVPWDTEALAREDMPGWNHIFRSFLLLPQPNFPVLGVGWTLVHEMYFYLVFALILLAPRKLLPAWLALWALVVTGGALLGWSGIYARNFVNLIFYPMTLEFIAGAITAWIFVKWGSFYPAIWLSLGLISLLLILIFYPAPTPFTLIWGRMLVFTLPCCLMIYGAAGLQHRLNGKAAKWMARLGDWSFGLYLSHMLTLSALRRLYPAVADVAETRFGLPKPIADVLRLGSPGILDNIFFLVTGILIATLVAAISYYLFEQPVLKFLSRFRHKQRDRDKAHLAETAAP